MSQSVLPDLTCVDEDARRHAIAADPAVQGIDYLEVRTTPPTQNQRFLEVHFIAKSTPTGVASLDALIDELVAQPTAIRITGGEREQQIKVGKPTRTGQMLVVPVDRPGDFSTYRLTLRGLGGGTTPPSSIDPAFGGIDFSFKAGCPTRFDCKGDCGCDEPALVEPAVDYLAKDFQSFKNALLDRLPTIAPEWTERHEADLGVALIELLSYAGDQLSYQQDAVANEAYLETARQRVSVRRHARLLDYRVDEGTSARVHVVAEVNGPCTVPVGSQLLTRLQAPFRGAMPPLEPVLTPDNPVTAELARANAVVFETLEPADFAPALGTMPIHTWLLADCCLPTGTTQLDVEGDVAFVADTPAVPATGTTPAIPAIPGKTEDWRLRPGRLLLIEETVGSVTGLAADADRTHRQVVRLTSAKEVVDPLDGHPLTRLTWAPADALRFPLCVTRRDDDGVVQPVAVAHGNVLVADHGQTREQYWPDTPAWAPGVTPPAFPPAGLVRTARSTRFLLEEGPLSIGLAPGGTGSVAAETGGPNTPRVSLKVERSASDKQDYTVAPDLIHARAFTPQFVAETMNDGRASIRFGDGTNGRPPTDGAFIHASYRVGRGREGNVGPESIAHLLAPFPSPPAPAAPLVPWPEAVTALRNPLPASGGRGPESSAQVKVRAPVAFRSPQLRAVTAADYAEVASRHPDVAGAVAHFRWTGSWLTVFLSIDPRDRGELPAELAADVKAFVAPFAQAGYDLEVRPPLYVPLDLELFVCVSADRFRADVEHAVLAALSSRRLPHGQLGFFHPDRFGFGDPLYLGALLAAAAAVPGVDSVTPRRFSRFFDDDPLPGRPLTRANVDAALITIGELEIVELAGDPSRPERGVLTVTTGGGR